MGVTDDDHDRAALRRIANSEYEAAELAAAVLEVIDDEPPESGATVTA
jgi:hypothetical protein